MSGQHHGPAALYPRDRAGTHFTGGWVGPQGQFRRAENLVPTGIQFPDRPVRSQSLYRLNYPAHKCYYVSRFFGFLKMRFLVLVYMFSRFIQVSVWNIFVHGRPDEQQEICNELSFSNCVGGGGGELFLDNSH